MTDATDSVPGTDPDRPGFTTALAAAHDQLIPAAGVITGTDIDLIGTIGRHVLTISCPPGESAPKTASSNARSPHTTPADPPSTGPPTRPPSQHQHDPGQPLTPLPQP